MTKLDITDIGDVMRVCRNIEQAHGRLDGLVNNAAVLDASPFEGLQYDRLEVS